jgi:CHAD domain-containing protein
MPTQQQTAVLDVHDAAVVIEENLAQRVLREIEQLRRDIVAERVHQLRVDIMRLRAILRSLPAGMDARSAHHLDTELRWLRHALARIRDWDVFLAAVTRLSLKGERYREFAPLRALCRARRETALISARRTLECKRAARLVLRLQRLAEQPGIGTQPGVSLRRSADAALSRAMQRVWRRGRHLSQLDAASLHRLRIALKRLRYVAEPLRGLYAPAAFDRYTEALLPLLKRLGSIQDAVLMTTIASRIEDANTAAMHKPAARMRRRGERLLKHQLRRLGDDWKAFKRQTPFWGRAR